MDSEYFPGGVASDAKATFKYTTSAARLKAAVGLIVIIVAPPNGARLTQSFALSVLPNAPQTRNELLPRRTAVVDTIE